MTDAYPLWTDTSPFPSRDAMAYPEGLAKVMVHRAGEDRYGFLHDTAIVSHEGTLFAAWYNCPSGEIVGESLIRGRRSTDDGLTWSPPEVIAADRDGRGLFYVPVSFLSHRGALYAFVSTMVGHDLVTGCEAFRLDKETRTSWEPCGPVAGPFLPNCAPVLMHDGRLIMAGRVAAHPGELPLTPAVAIGDAENPVSTWAIVPLVPIEREKAAFDLPYPETTVIVERDEIIALVRNDRGNALLFRSTDGARTWSGPHAHTFPIGAARIYAGTLSTGQRYLLSNTPTPGYRELLTLAVTPPNKPTFSRIWKLHDGPSKELAAGPEWSYPCAIEHDAKLHVVCTSEKHHCVLATVPLMSLR